MPYSKYAEIYNRQQLSAMLAEKGIKYSFVGKFFGARQDDIELYHREGYLDFEKTSHSDLFIRGMLGKTCNER